MFHESDIPPFLGQEAPSTVEDSLRFEMLFLKYFFSILIMFVILPANGEARDYNVRKKNGGFVVDIAINRNPPILGDNDIRIEIKDSAGKHVTGASVYVNYYMPPMPGMPPMNYTVPARLEDDKYIVTMDLIMRRPWNIVIKVNDNSHSWRVAFPIDVR